MSPLCLLRVPHILLLPSDLSHFVREVEKCTVINPGRITRGQVGPHIFLYRLIVDFSIWPLHKNIACLVWSFPLHNISRAIQGPGTFARLKLRKEEKEGLTSRVEVIRI